MNVIDAADVYKRYKNGIQALNGFQLSVKEGEIFTLLGENGAGKSTLIKILTTFLKASSGHINILGRNMLDHASYIRSNIACVSQQISIDVHVSLHDNMMFQAKLYKVPYIEAKQRMNKLIEEFDLTPYASYPVISYSGGIKRRLDIAMNMMSSPKILFLDEPTVGMDIQSRKAMWNMVRKIRDEFNTTVFLTTHYLEEAEQLSDTICIMRDGRNAIQGSSNELKTYFQQERIKITLYTNDQVKALETMLLQTFHLENIESKENAIFISTNHCSQVLQDITMFLFDQHIPFCGIEIIQPTMEDIFLKLTAKGVER